MQNDLDRQNASSEASLHAVDYWQVLKNRYGVILLTFLLIFMTAAVITYVLPKKYESVCVVQVNPAVLELDPLAGMTGPPTIGAYYTRSYMQNEFKAIEAEKTLQRVVDVLLGALGLAAASQGSMNNVTFGNADFGYYETLGGGAGGGPEFDGASGVHTHMTNTRITDPEVLEARYPVRLERFSLRPNSGGAGLHPGGDGLVRAYRFLADVTLSLLTERRDVSPWGLEGGGHGACGRNVLVHRDGRREALAAKCSRSVAAGQCLIVETPGGGGWGCRESSG